MAPVPGSQESFVQALLSFEFLGVKMHPLMESKLSSVQTLLSLQVMTQFTLTLVALALVMVPLPPVTVQLRAATPPALTK